MDPSGRLVRRVLLRAIPLVALALAPAASWAQAREERRYTTDDSEGRLMAYYSAAIAYSPTGVPSIARAGGIAFAVEVSYLPALSRAQRTAGSDKAEATNLAPAFPRPRLYVGIPGGATLEASWVPPVRTFDVTANLISLALSRPIGRVGAFQIIPRLSMLTGRVKGAITCDRSTAEKGGEDLQVYYRAVCHGAQSEDFFEPSHLSAEAMIVRRVASSALSPYVALGARAERTHFDVGVKLNDGSRDPDQPILELRTTRGYGAAGVSWMPEASRLRGALELYYAPGSVVTVRALAGVRIR